MTASTLDDSQDVIRPTVDVHAIGWPVAWKPNVFHVGSLDPAMKLQTHNTTSLEGSGLSVSEHPDEWREIAKLGDSPVWGLRCDEIPLFVDARALVDEQRQLVAAWGQSVGLVAPVEVYRVTFRVDDDESYFDSTDKAAMERELSEVVKHADGTAVMQTRAGWAASSLMNNRLGFNVDIALVEDLLLTLYVEDVLYPEQRLCGVWWNDRLEPGALSAPRGVIHPRALADWQAVDADRPDSDPRQLSGLSGKGQVSCSYRDGQGDVTHCVAMKARIERGTGAVVICGEPMPLLPRTSKGIEAYAVQWNPLVDPEPVSNLMLAHVVYEDDLGMSMPLVVQVDGSLVRQWTVEDAETATVDAQSMG